MSDRQTRLIWIDLEMTGLNPEQDRIIELATIITDNNLEILIESPSLVVFQPQSLLESMDDWNQRQHKSSGLIERVKGSTLNESQAENLMLEFLKKYVDKGASPMCGSTVYQDRRFLARYMPTLEQYFHYRLLDVSTIKELAKRWQPELYRGYKKQSTHLALQDIRDSIDELRYYRQTFLKFTKDI